MYKRYNTSSNSVKSAGTDISSSNRALCSDQEIEAVQVYTVNRNG